MKKKSLKKITELINKFYYWNYKVVLKLDLTDCSCNIWYTKNKPTFWDKDPPCETWESDAKTLKKEYEHMMKALKK